MTRIKVKSTARAQKEASVTARCKVRAKTLWPGWPVPDDMVVEAVTKTWSIEEIRAFWANVLMEHYSGSMSRTRESMRMSGWSPPSVAQLTELLAEEPCKSWLEGGGLTRERRAGLATDFDVKLFWSKILLNPREARSFRFRASENLAKAFGMFVEHHKHEVGVSVADAIKLLNERGKAS